MRTILVTGDFLVDHHIYEGRRHHFGDQTSRGVCVHEELGGAALIHKLLTELQPRSGAAWQSLLSVDDAAALKRLPPCPTDAAGCVDQPFASYAFWRTSPPGT